MKRREFLKAAGSVAATAAIGKHAFAQQAETVDAAWYSQNRKFVQLPLARVAYVERGNGPLTALFMHGFPLNSYQWRGALERLSKYRHCIAPDVMGLGFTEVPATQAITPATQVKMLGALLDRLNIQVVDLVGNDSGGLLSQLFVATYPHRVRTLFLTNCDVDKNSPPAEFVPLINLAKKGLFVKTVLVPEVADKNLARSAGGLGGVYSYPDKLADETLDIYLKPLASSDLRKRQADEYAVALGENVLVPIREKLHRWKGPARMVWGLKDTLFPADGAEWLDKTLPGSRGIRHVDDAKLFFPEEMPDLIAEEAVRLWDVKI
ncbi:MAG: alpha/beta hydrolase [Terracidiphilus sp.]